MDYILTATRQTAGVRIYAFDAVGADRNRTAFTVSIDTGLIRQYAIARQELPLLCRQFLEKQAGACDSQTLTFTENEMTDLKADRAERLRVALQRRSIRKNPVPAKEFERIAGTNRVLP